MTKKNLGIWMDHSMAHLMDLNHSNKSQTIHSDFTHEQKVDVLQKSEGHMQNKRQQMHEAYYKEIAGEILSYDHVLLFGPTNARLELYNYLHNDRHFNEIKIDTESADKLTDNQQLAFAKQHFEHF